MIKNISKTVETFLGNGLAMPRAWLKHTVSTVKTYGEQGRNTSRKVETNLKGGQNIHQAHTEYT